MTPRRQHPIPWRTRQRPVWWNSFPTTPPAPVDELDPAPLDQLVAKFSPLIEGQAERMSQRDLREARVVDALERIAAALEGGKPW